MRLTDKRFWFLFLVMANVVATSAQTCFSVDKSARMILKKQKTVSKNTFMTSVKTA